MLKVLLLFVAIEVGPQPNGVVRADIYNIVKEAVDHTIEWLEGFNSGEQQLMKVKGSKTKSKYTYMPGRIPLGINARMF